ncbi:hypothetical protein ACQ4WX_43190 [Streptomyces lasalocidi]
MPSFPHGWYDAACLADDRPVLVLAAHYEQGVNRLVDPRDGTVLAERAAGQAVSADPVRPLRWAVPEPGADPRTLQVHDLGPGGGGPQRLPVEHGVRRPAWSPDGRLLAAGTRGRVVVWGVGAAAAADGCTCSTGPTRGPWCAGWPGPRTAAGSPRPRAAPQRPGRGLGHRHLAAAADLRRGRRPGLGARAVLVRRLPAAGLRHRRTGLRGRGLGHRGATPRPCARAPGRGRRASVDAALVTGGRPARGHLQLGRRGAVGAVHRRPAHRGRAAPRRAARRNWSASACWRPPTASAYRWTCSATSWPCCAAPSRPGCAPSPTTAACTRCANWAGRGPRWRDWPCSWSRTCPPPPRTWPRPRSPPPTSPRRSAAR